MNSTEKAKIYKNVWCCAYQRRYMYRGTPREYREHETILMCLNMKGAKWYQFDTEKPHYLK
jgi:hypothetical protein